MSSCSLRCAMAIFLLATVSACSTPKAGGLFRDTEALGKGHYVDKSRVDLAALREANFSAIVLAEIDTSRVADQDGITRQEGAATLFQALTQAPSDPRVLKLSGSGAIGRLEVAIVEMSTGDAIARVLAGELGAGHAWVQVDARLVNPTSGQVVAEFSDRQRGSGAIGFRDTFGSSGPAMVREMLTGIGRALRDELRNIFYPQ